MFTTCTNKMLYQKAKSNTRVNISSTLCYTHPQTCIDCGVRNHNRRYLYG